MSYRDAFQGLDDIPTDDPLFQMWEALHYNYLQAAYERHEDADELRRERDVWMSATLARWWNL